MPTPERLNPVMDVSEDAQSPSLYPREKQYFEFCPVEFVDNGAYIEGHCIDIRMIL